MGKGCIVLRKLSLQAAADGDTWYRGKGSGGVEQQQGDQGTARNSHSTWFVARDKKKSPRKTTERLQDWPRPQLSTNNKEVRQAWCLCMANAASTCMCTKVGRYVL